MDNNLMRENCWIFNLEVNLLMKTNLKVKTKISNKNKLNKMMTG